MSPRGRAATERHLRGELRGTPLTAREQEVLVAVVNNAPPGQRGKQTVPGGYGKSKRTVAAAAALGVSYATIRHHLANASLRLGARSTEHAVALAFPLLHDRYLETPDRRRMAALAYEILERGVLRAAA